MRCCLETDKFLLENNSSNVSNNTVQCDVFPMHKSCYMLSGFGKNVFCWKKYAIIFFLCQCLPSIPSGLTEFIIYKLVLLIPPLFKGLKC